MNWIGRDKVGGYWIGSEKVSALYLGAVKIWEAVSSCFGTGVWREDKPWKDDDAWKD